MLVREWKVPLAHGAFERLLHAKFNDQRLHTSDATEFFQITDELKTVTEIDTVLAMFLARLANAGAIRDIQQEDEELVPVDADTHRLLARRRDLSAQTQLLTAERSDVDAQIKHIIGSHAGVQEGTRTRPLATWKTTNSHRFDQDAFKKDYPDLFSQYNISTRTRRYCVLD
jgi:hypothetical protein